jgi:hypothetical protein
MRVFDSVRVCLLSAVICALSVLDFAQIQPEAAKCGLPR